MTKRTRKKSRRSKALIRRDNDKNCVCRREAECGVTSDSVKSKLCRVCVVIDRGTYRWGRVGGEVVAIGRRRRSRGGDTCGAALLTHRTACALITLISACVTPRHYIDTPRRDDRPPRPKQKFVLI